MSDDRSALISLDGEREVLSYSNLQVVDARGRQLPATMDPTATGFAIAYHDTDAIYPVTVDPLIVNEVAKFNRIDAAASDHFGRSVAISGDTIVIGAERADDGGTNSGTRMSSKWSGRSRRGGICRSPGATEDQEINESRAQNPHSPQPAGPFRRLD